MLAERRLKYYHARESPINVKSISLLRTKVQPARYVLANNAMFPLLALVSISVFIPSYCVRMRRVVHSLIIDWSHRTVNERE